LSTPRATPASQSISLIVNDVGRLFRRRFEQIARARRLGLTRAQSAVLIHLARNEGSNQVTLAQGMDLEPITLVRLLDRLQTAGYIERRASPGDRRAYSLFLTPSAQPLLRRIETLADEIRDEALAGVPPEDHATLQRVLAAMKVNLLGQVAAHAEDEVDFVAEQVIHG
jgi:DNA-binding MarR family transcriptional regulator